MAHWLSSVKTDGGLVESDGSQFFVSPNEIDFSQLEGVTVQEWLDKNRNNSVLEDLHDQKALDDTGTQTVKFDKPGPVDVVVSVDARTKFRRLC